MNTRPTPLHTRNGGNVVEDGKALKRRLTWLFAGFYVCIGMALGIFVMWGIAKIIVSCLK